MTITHICSRVSRKIIQPSWIVKGKENPRQNGEAGKCAEEQDNKSTDSF